MDQVLTSDPISTYRETLNEIVDHLSALGGSLAIVNASSPSATVPTGAAAPVRCPNEEHDPGGNHTVEVSDSYFTAPVDGTYELDIYARGALDNSTILEAGFKHDNIGLPMLRVVGLDSGDTSIAYRMLWQLDEGDKVRPLLGHDYGADRTFFVRHSVRLASLSV